MKAIPSRQQPKVMIIGIDGCTFDLLNKFIARDMLPNFSRLVKEGASGRLHSTVPPTSPPAWSTFHTGKDPGKHGIFDFFRNDFANYTYTPLNATFLKEETFWMRLSRLGKRVGVVNFLMTYPPQPINGFIISGKETPSEAAAYTYPEHLKGEILEHEPAFEVEPFKRVNHSRNFLLDVIAKLSIQEKVNAYLLKHHATDLFMNMFAMPDIIHHVFWRHIDEAHPLYDSKEAKIYAPLVESVFEKLDEIIGNRLQGLRKDAIMLVLSDHGACGFSKIVQINKWLLDHQLLFLRQKKVIRNSVLSFAMHQLKNVDRALSKFDRLGLRRLVKHSTVEMRRTYAKLNLIDWSRTKAYMGRPGECGIFCNVKGREKFGIVSPGEEYEAVRDEIITKLNALKDPATNQRVFMNVFKREELYQGPYNKYAPDVIVESGDRPYMEGDKLFCRQLFEDLTKASLTGKHHPDGILMVVGKGIKSNYQLSDIHIRDVAPTILYMMGEKIPIDMDGRVITELFEPNVIDARTIDYDSSVNSVKEASEILHNAEESLELEKRLKDLGYL